MCIIGGLFGPGSLDWHQVRIDLPEQNKSWLSRGRHFFSIPNSERPCLTAIAVHPTTNIKERSSTTPFSAFSSSRAYLHAVNRYRPSSISRCHANNIPAFTSGYTELVSLSGAIVLIQNGRMVLVETEMLL